MHSRTQAVPVVAHDDLDGLAALAAEQRQGAEESFQLLVESVSDCAIMMLDAAGRVKTWNSGAQRIKGYEASEILGRSISSFFTPDDIAAHKPENALRHAAASGRYLDDGWRVRKDGTRFWANVVLNAIRDGDG